MVKPEAATEAVKLGGKALHVGMGKDAGPDFADGLAAASFGQRQNAVGMAVQWGGGGRIKCVGNLEELAADGVDTRVVDRIAPWHVAECLGIARLIDG